MHVTTTCAPTPLVARAAALLRQHPGSHSCTLSIDMALASEGFAITDDAAGRVRISGQNARGLFYGVGKHLREPDWRGSSAPRRPVRGMYFASHFHNFYHDAPVEAIEAYVEELALWGCNALAVWFDMHHFEGLHEAEAQAMVVRLRLLLKAAKAVGMDTALTTLSNEAYAASPEALRADWRPGQHGYIHELRGHYHVELCPSQPGAIEQTLAWRREMLTAFADIGIDYVWIWPYDQGGCTCADCAPWGANGFLRIARPYAQLVRELLPDARIILSTWYFDHFIKGEWEAFYAAIGDDLSWADYLMINPADLPIIRERGAPGGLPVLDFPEISMHAGSPWGGYGAHPYAARLATYAATTGDLLAGSFPYSEGIFEDINKVLMLQWAWEPERQVDAILREYAHAYLGEAVAERFVALARGLEEDAHTWLHLVYQGQPVDPYVSHRVIPNGAAFSHRFKLGEQPRAEAMLILADEIAAELTDDQHHQWRWRIIHLRARIDAELKAHHGEPTDALDALMEELNTIYHAEQAEIPVVAPSTSALTRILGNRRVAF